MLGRIQKLIDAGKTLDEAVVEAAAPMRKMFQMALKREPFVPFRIHLSSGSDCEVQRPEWVVVKDCTASLLKPDPDNPGKLRAWCILALIHVVSLEFSPPDEPVIAPAVS